MASRLSQRWLRKMGAAFMVALVIGSVVCAVYAQNAAPTDEPSADIVTPEPTTFTPVDRPTDTPRPTELPTTEAPPQPATAAPPQPTALPTTEVPVQPVTDVPTTEAPTQLTDVPTTAPTDITVTAAPTDALPTEASAVESTAAVIDATTETPPTATVENPPGDDITTTPTLPATATDAPTVTLTVEPTSSDTPTTEIPDTTPERTQPADMPIETATATPSLPDPASISLSVDTASVIVGDTVTLTLSGEFPEAVAIISALCEVDPARLSGLSATAGDGVTNAAVTDSGFLPSGQWVLRAQSALDAEIRGSGTLWQLRYQTSVEGQALVACRVQLINAAGNLLPLTSNAVAQAIEVVPAVATANAPEVTVEAPTDVPEPGVEATELPEATVEAPVDVPEATLEPTPEATSVLDPIGPELTLEPIPGDVDRNGIVNQDDADLVLRYFGQPVPSDAPSVDVNGDGMINIYDLTIVAGNMNKTGASAGGLLRLDEAPQAQ